MIQLLILGLLKQYPGTHGYELLKLMNNNHYQYLVSFTKGSFYYNLQQMEKKSLIMQKENEQDSDIHYYYVTKKGEEAFEQLMLKYGKVSEYVNLTFYVPMLFHSMLDQEDYVGLLDAQIEQTNKRIVDIENTLEHNGSELESNFKLMLENSLAHHQVNLEWFMRLKSKSKV